jgi:queuosine precursor transporter
VLLFPITYIFGDVFTEVYGYAASRRAIWLGFFGTSLLYVIGAIVIALPSAPGWQNQQAFATVFGFIPRILAASLIAFWAGEFANSYTMARLKLITDGRKLWTAHDRFHDRRPGRGHGPRHYPDVRWNLPRSRPFKHHGHRLLP